MKHEVPIEYKLLMEVSDFLKIHAPSPELIEAISYASDDIFFKKAKFWRCLMDYKKYGFDMISYGTKLTGKTKEEILYTDFKKYPTDEGLIGLGQIFTTNIEEISKEEKEYIDMLNNISKVNEYKFIALFVTDIIKQGTYVYYSSEAKDILEKAFNTKIEEGTYLPEILSRKMQILPAILDIMN